MRSLRWGCVFLCAAALALASLPASAGGQQVQFRTRVEALQFQVAVADESGAFVPGLSTDDFRVRVGGEDREVISAYEVDLGAVATADASGVDLETLPAAGWRQFVLFFDNAFNSPRGVRSAQQAALQFLDEQLLPTDTVSVVTFNVVEGVRVLLPLSRDRQQARQAVQGLGLTQATRTIDRPGFLATVIQGDGTAGTAGSDEGGGSAGSAAAAEAVADILAVVSRAEYSQYQSWVSSYVRQIGRLGEILQVIRGRKQVLFFTAGFEDRVLTGKSLDELTADRNLIGLGGEGLAAVNPEESYGSAEVRSAMEDALGELRNADTVLHMIDVSGVGGDQGSAMMGQMTPGRVTPGRSSLTVWASGTGGSVVWNTNDLGGALADIERGARQYYVLAIPRRADDAEELRLQVEVVRPGVRVTAAPSRFAPPPGYEDMSDMQRQAQLAEFVTKGLDETGMSFDVAAVPFPGRNEIARVPVVLEVPWTQLEQLGQARGDDRVSLDVLGYVITDAGVMIDLTDRHVDLDLGRMRGRMEGLPLRLYDLLWAWPGHHSVRVVVRESELGLTSAATVRIEVPEAAAGQLALAPPVVLDAEHPGLIMRTFDAADPPSHKMDGPVAYPFVAGGEELTPMARGDLQAGQPWEILVTAFNLTGHPFTGQMQPLVEVVLDNGSGNRVPLTATLLGQAADPAAGTATLWLGIANTAAARPGFYRLSVKVTDGITGTAAERATDVWVR